MRGRWYLATAALVVVAGVAAVGFAAAGTSGSKAKKTTKVTLQLKWVAQAQFAGYYAAQAKGYYKQAGLDVKLKLGGPDISPEQVVLGGGAEFGIDWLPSLLAQRDTGNDLVDIGQVFARSGTTEVTWKSSGINSFKKMKGKKFGVWILGNEFEQEAALVKNGLDPHKDVTLVKQNFDVIPFLKHEIDATSAMTYNELAQILEAKNPKTGKLYTMKDLNVFKMSSLGTGMLQDLIFVKNSWIKDKAHQATAVKFLQASLKGWIYCRDHRTDCVNYVLKAGTALPKGHQTWQTNEINALIWPNKLGVGIMDPKAFKNTANIAYKFKVIKKPASTAAYRNDLVKKAVAALKKQGVDVYGKRWKKATVKLTAGGK
jgi:NitT/TauT family transport system substrate-binding protein